MSRSDPRARLRAPARRLRREEGISLVEVVAMLAMMSIVTGAFLAVFARVLKDTEIVQARRDYLNDMRIAMEQATKQIRQVTAVDTMLPDYFGMDTLIDGTAAQVNYRAVSSDPTHYDLVREVDGGAAVTILSNLTTSSIFTYTTVDGTLQQVDILFTVDTGTNTVDLSSEVETRNL